MPLFIPVSNRLLRGPPKEVTTDVWRATLTALTECLVKYHVGQGPFLPSGTSIEAVLKTLNPGLTHLNRPVRLAAGYAIFFFSFFGNQLIRR